MARTTSERRSITVADGTALVYESRPGSGPTLIMIHGWACRRAHWAAQATLADAGYGCISMDLAGHGESSAVEREWSLMSFARDVLAVMDAEAVQDAVLVGHSLGGAVAVELARFAGGRIRALILADTFVIDYGMLDQQAQEALYQPFARDFRREIVGMVRNMACSAPAALQRRLIRDMAATDPACALPAWRALLAWNPLPAFNEIDTPVHAINGSLITPATRERLQPYMSETLLAGSGHFPHLEAPQGFNRAVLDYLNKAQR